MRSFPLKVGDKPQERARGFLQARGTICGMITLERIQGLGGFGAYSLDIFEESLFFLFFFLMCVLYSEEILSMEMMDGWFSG